MNKCATLLVFLVLFAACIGKHRSDAQSAAIANAATVVDEMAMDTLEVDLKRSTIHWMVTEMRGTIKRTGAIQFKDAYLLVDDLGLLTGGRFTVDMETIDVTDIPKSEVIARKNVIQHLRSDSFFDVDQHPIATFEITDAQKVAADRLKVYGNLSIRGVTKQIVFDAENDDHTFKTRFVFDRFQWNIAYHGSWVNKTLIDQAIELTIELAVK